MPPSNPSRQFEAPSMQLRLLSAFNALEIGDAQHKPPATEHSRRTTTTKKTNARPNDAHNDPSCLDNYDDPVTLIEHGIILQCNSI